MASRVVLAMILAFVAALSATVAGQSQSFARVMRNGGEAVMSVLDPRPLDAAATLLAKEFGVHVNVEDPLYFGRDDIEDVTDDVSPNSRRKPSLTSTGTVLERHFELDADGAPRDVRGLLRDAVNDANAQAPFAYRMDATGEMFTLVATRTRDSQGRAIQFTPILDRRITIPRGTRRVDQHLALLMKSLEAETGVRIGCCSATGDQWGSAVVTYGGIDEPARNALRRLLHAEAAKTQSPEQEPARYQWLLRCQTRELWCFINVVRVPRKA